MRIIEPGAERRCRSGWRGDVQEPEASREPRRKVEPQAGAYAFVGVAVVPEPRAAEDPGRDPFENLCRLLGRFGFDERIRGDHHIFSKPNVAEILNLQPRGRHAKPYQVKQVRGVIVKYRLGDDADGK